MIDFEVGAKPTRPLSIAVRDEQDNPVSLLGYTSWSLEMLGTDNEPVDMRGVNITAVPTAVGVLSVDLPKNRSIFEKKGRYVLRLVLNAPDGGKDITRSAEIRVREFGGKN